MNPVAAIVALVNPSQKGTLVIAIVLLVSILAIAGIVRIVRASVEH